MFANVGKKNNTVSNISKVVRHRACLIWKRKNEISISFVRTALFSHLSLLYHPISLHFIDIISFFQVQINTHDESFIYHKIGFFFLFLPIFWSIIILFLYGNMVHRTKQGETTYLQIYVILVCHRKNYIWRTLFQYDFSSVRLKFKQ